MADLQWRGGESCLETQPWTTITLNEKVYLIKGLFTNDSYKLLVTDFASVWQENLKNKELLDRSKSLNPFVDVPLPVLLQQLGVRLQSPQQYAFTIEKSIDEQFVLSVEGPLQDASGPHYLWKFFCSISDPQILNTHLLTPLMSVAVELLRRQQELVSIIGRKDREIKDYQDNGATVSRKHLQTMPFDLKTFNDEMIRSREFKDSVNHPLKLIESSNWHNLYKDTTSYKHWQTTRPVSSGGVDGNAEVTGTMLTSSPSKPYHRKTIDSPEKQEKTRREALEKQIEEGKAKGKRKKRKLM